MSKLFYISGFVLAAAMAPADILTLNEDAGTNVHWTLFGNHFSTYTGRLVLHYGGNDYLGFCADAALGYVDSMNYAVGDTTMLPPVFPNVHQNQIAYLVNKYTASANDLTTGTALQLAIWDELYDTQPGDVTNPGGNFHVDGTDVLDYNTTTALANSFMLDAITNATPQTSLYFYPDGNVNQSFVAPPVPEPATMAALGLGLIALRRRKKSA